MWIFICLGDVIGQGKPIHHFTMKDEYGNDWTLKI
jgi:hypothetical protein